MTSPRSSALSSLWVQLMAEGRAGAGDYRDREPGLKRIKMCHTAVGGQRERTSSAGTNVRFWGGGIQTTAAADGSAEPGDRLAARRGNSSWRVGAQTTLKEDHQVGRRVCGRPFSRIPRGDPIFEFVWEGVIIG